MQQWEKRERRPSFCRERTSTAQGKLFADSPVTSTMHRSTLTGLGSRTRRTTTVMYDDSRKDQGYSLDPARDKHRRFAPRLLSAPRLYAIPQAPKLVTASKRETRSRDADHVIANAAWSGTRLWVTLWLFLVFRRLRKFRPANNLSISCNVH